MQELVNSDVDMIVPIATPAAQAAMASTKTIPIVFSAVSNPVEAGLVTSFDATTGNITGVSNSIPIEDIFALAAKVTPKAKVFGFVYNSSEINSTSGIERAKAYCAKHGLQYKEATITGTADVQQAASSLVGQVDAFFTPNDNTVASAMAVYVKVATDAKLPIYAGADSMVKDGALATVGIDYVKLGKQTAAMIMRIVNGQTIKENHVEQVAEYANMINMGTANKLGITISDELKQQFVILGQ
jgi:putative ABC transport system substrate-binding protein